MFTTFDGAGCRSHRGCIRPPDCVVGGPRLQPGVISPYATGGHANNTDAEQSSLVKSIVANRKPPTIRNGRGDNLSDPVATAANSCVPINSPAIDD